MKVSIASDWQDRAACKGTDIDQWICGERGGRASATTQVSRSAARLMCTGNLREVPECPVRRECGILAVRHGESNAIRAGYATWIARERQALARWVSIVTETLA